MSEINIDLTGPTLPAGVTLGPNAVFTPGEGILIAAGNVTVDVPNLLNGGFYDLTVKGERKTDNDRVKLITHVGDPFEYSNTFKVGVYGTGNAYKIGGSDGQLALTTNFLGNWNATAAAESVMRVIYSAGLKVQCYGNGKRVSIGADADYRAPEANPNAVRIEASGTFLLTSIASSNFIDNLTETEYNIGDEVTFAGGPFGATRDGLDLTLTTLGVVYDNNSQITNWTDGEVKFTLADPHIKYGTELRYDIGDGGDTNGGNSVTVIPIATLAFVDVIDPIKGQAGIHSLFDGSTGDAPDNNSQIEYDKTVEAEVRSNGTFQYKGSATTFDLAYRVFSHADKLWGNTATATVNVTPGNKFDLSRITLSDKGPGGIKATVTTEKAEGTLYGVSVRLAKRPSIEQIKTGKDYNGDDAAWSGNANVTAATAMEMVSAGQRAGDYVFYIVHEDASGVVTNVSSESYYIYGEPVPPVFSVQPVAGSVQSRVLTSEHTLTCAATPNTAMQWQVKAPGGEFVDIDGAIEDTYVVKGAGLRNEDDGTLYRCRVDGLGLAVGYTDEVAIKVHLAPHIDITIDTLPTARHHISIWDNENGDMYINQDVYVENGKMVYVLGSGKDISGRTVFGQTRHDPEDDGNLKGCSFTATVLPLPEDLT